VEEPTTGAVNGVVVLMRYLAVDLAPIRVKVVRSGLIDTGLWDYLEDFGCHIRYFRTAVC
jgi:NAD(P)-dependent dehydrogenase (short-subunit alcohol dehydrogenase family)